MTVHTMPCPHCNGTGLVARPVAMLAEGDHVRRYLDGMPHIGQETCSKCGGGGAVPLDPKTIQET